MTYYELATLSTVIFGAGKAAPGIEAYLREPQTKGTLLGAWSSDIGQLNQIYILRSFETHADLLDERERLRRSSNPFNASEFLTGLEVDSYRPFDFLPPVQPGKFGPIYEIRNYELKRGALMDTMARWQDAVPTRSTYSPLTIAMYGIDGANRLVNIWPYASLNDRQAIRAKSVADGAWPPKNGPDGLTPNMASTIALPLGFSPLQ